MKHFFCALTMLCLSFSLYSKTIYVSLSLIQKAEFSHEYHAKMDFGKINKYISLSNGSIKEFSNEIEVINYLSEYGWKLVPGNYMLIDNVSGKSKPCLILSKNYESDYDIYKGIDHELNTPDELPRK